ncbi:hypothetical protein AgCh_004292 [Apium graveolens]
MEGDDKAMNEALECIHNYSLQNLAKVNAKEDWKSSSALKEGSTRKSYKNALLDSGNSLNKADFLKVKQKQSPLRRRGLVLQIQFLSRTYHQTFQLEISGHSSKSWGLLGILSSQEGMIGREIE